MNFSGNCLPYRIVADNILIFYYFSENIRPDISCELSLADNSYEMSTYFLYK